jgi:hypothetical protein
VWGSEGITPPFLTLTLDTGEWLVSRLGRFTPRGKSCRYPSDRRLDGSQSTSGRCEVQNNLLRLSGTETRPSSPRSVALPTKLSRFLKWNIVYPAIKTFWPSSSYFKYYSVLIFQLYKFIFT